MPGFYSRRSGIPAPESVPDDRRRGARDRRPPRRSGSAAGSLVCTPVPEADALPFEAARAAVERAIGEAEAAGIAGPAVTPWLLARVAELTDGASVRANTALIVNDARVAGALAAELAELDQRAATT